METLSLFDADLHPAVAVDDPVASVPAAAAPAAPAAPPPSAPVLLAVDGNSLAHRAFHAYTQPRVDGSPGPGGRYGFLAMLAAVCDKARPDALVVGFDCRATSVRRQRYPGYKAQRPDTDPQIQVLLDDIADLLDELGVLVVQPTGWEADDVLGSAAAAAEAAGWRAVLATSDRDAFALVSDTTTVLRLRSGMDNAVEVTPRRLRRDVGVAPWQYLELAALRGDASDNLPGIPGIGRARAAQLLAAYPTVADAVADPLGCRSVLGRPLGQALLDDLADAASSVFLRNVDLMTIRRDVPVDLADCALTTTPERVVEVLRSWRLPSLRGRMTLALCPAPDDDAPPPDAPPVL